MRKINLVAWILAQSLVLTDKENATSRAESKMKKASEKGDDEQTILWAEVIEAVTVMYEKRNSNKTH